MISKNDMPCQKLVPTHCRLAIQHGVVRERAESVDRLIVVTF